MKQWCVAVASTVNLSIILVKVEPRRMLYAAVVGLLIFMYTNMRCCKMVNRTGSQTGLDLLTFF